MRYQTDDHDPWAGIQHVSGGAFIPIIFACTPPPGLNPADARIVFAYDANDPGGIPQMGLAAADTDWTRL